MRRIAQVKPISKYLNEMIASSNAAEYNTPPVDWDSSLIKLARNVFLRMGVREADPDAYTDSILSILPVAIDKKFLDDYNPNFGTTLPQYIMRRVQQRLITAGRSLLVRQRRQVDLGPNRPEDDRTQEERLDALNPQTEESEEDKLEYKQLIKGLSDYIAEHGANKRVSRIFELMLLGYNNTEIAEELGVSRGFLSQQFAKIKSLIADYAAETGNTDLQQGISQLMSTRRSAVADDAQQIHQLLMKFLARQVTAAKIIKKRIRDISNPTAQAAINELVNNGTTAQKQLMDDFFGIVKSADDLVIYPSDDNEINALFFEE